MLLITPLHAAADSTLYTPPSPRLCSARVYCISPAECIWCIWEVNLMEKRCILHIIACNQQYTQVPRPSALLQISTRAQTAFVSVFETGFESAFESVFVTVFVALYYTGCSWSQFPGRLHCSCSRSQQGDAGFTLPCKYKDINTKNNRKYKNI